MTAPDGRRVCNPEKWGARRLVKPTDVEALGVFGIRREARYVTTTVDETLERTDLVEVPGTRHGEWEYREHVYTVAAEDLDAYLAAQPDGTDPEAATARFLDQARHALESTTLGVFQFDTNPRSPAP